MLESLKPFAIDFFTENLGSIHLLYILYWYAISAAGFLGTLLIAYYLSDKLRVFDTTRVSIFLVSKVFPTKTEFEENKIALIRIAFGSIILVRQLFIAKYMLPSELLGIEGVFLALSILATLLIMVGFVTQHAIIFSIFILWRPAEKVLGVSTLGNDVAAILAVALFLCQSGRFLSLDSIVLAKKYKFKSILFYWGQKPSKYDLAFAKLLAVISYGSMCIYSVCHHLADPAWLSGAAAPLLLTSNFLSSYANFFQWSFHQYPISIEIGRIGMWLMFPWYCLIIPGVLLGGFLRNFIIYWGILFFIASTFVLQLGFLGEIEFLLWLLLFWNGVGMKNTNKLRIFYDDRCNLCDKTVRAIGRLDLFGTVKFAPLTKIENQSFLEKKGINLHSALNDLHGAFDKGDKIYVGYSFYLKLAQSILVLWPVVPFLFLGKWMRVGPFIYRKIADKRIEVFGTCEFAKTPFHYSTGVSDKPVSLPVKIIALHVIILSLSYLASAPIPNSGPIVNPRNPLFLAAHFYGIAPIHVFDEDDLRMENTFFTLKSIESSGEKKLVPLLDENGNRLEMHRSDRIYFGGTLRYRRNAEFKNCNFAKYENLMVNFASINSFKTNKDLSKSQLYEYTQYFKPTVSSRTLTTSGYKDFRPEIVCSVQFEVH